MGLWKWLNSPPDGGNGDSLLWMLLPGYMLLDEQGRRARWPRLYEAKWRRDRALEAGAVPARSDINHNIIDPWCQFAVTDHGAGTVERCQECYPEPGVENEEYRRGSKLQSLQPVRRQVP